MIEQTPGHIGLAIGWGTEHDTIDWARVPDDDAPLELVFDDAIGAWCLPWPAWLVRVKPKALRRPYIPRDMRSTAATWIAETIAGLPATLTTDETCAALRMSRRNLYRLIETGKLRGRRARDSGSSPWLIPRAELERYLRNL